MLVQATVLKSVKERELKDLQLHDQLRRIKRVGEAFWGFEEGHIEFQPTYRYDRGTRETYAYEKAKGGGKIKINAPSYTDRVLWRSFPSQSLTQTSYGCTTDIVTSDHSPVFATFDLLMANQFVSRSKGANLCKIVIESASASVLASSKSAFFLEFYGNFFEGQAKSDSNTATGEKDIGDPARGQYPSPVRSMFRRLAPHICLLCLPTHNVPQFIYHNLFTTRMFDKKLVQGIPFTRYLFDILLCVW